MMQGQNLKTLTMRDNIIWNVSNSITYLMDSSAVDARVYRNKIYGPVYEDNDRFFRLGARTNFPAKILADTYVSTINNYYISPPGAVTANIDMPGGTNNGVSGGYIRNSQNTGTDHPLHDVSLNISGAKWVFHDNEFYLSGAEDRRIFQYYASDTGSYSFEDNVFWSPDQTSPFQELGGATYGLTEFNAEFGTTTNTSSNPDWWDPDVGDFSPRASGA